MTIQKPLKLSKIHKVACTNQQIDKPLECLSTNDLKTLTSFTLGSSKAIGARTSIWGHAPSSIETATFTDSYKIKMLQVTLGLLTG